MTWPEVQLKDVAEMCLGKMLDAKKNKGDLYPYLRNPNVQWMTVDLSDLKRMPFEPHELERYGLRAGDVLICEGGEAGRAAIWDGLIPDIKIQKAIHRVRPRPELLNRFLLHRIRYDYERGALADYYTGATIKHLTGQDLARYKFELPPLEEQKRIAAILDQADGLRRKPQRALDRLNQLGQAIFIEMFGEGEGDVPISEYLDDIQSGKNLVGVSGNNGSGFRVLKISAVSRNGFRPGETKPLPSDYVPPPAHIVSDGDLLFSRANTNQLVGIPCIVEGVHENVALPDKLWRLVPVPGKSDTAFLCHALLTQASRRQIENMSSGTSGSMQNISMQKFNSILVPRASLRDQLTFRDAISGVSSAKHQFEMYRYKAEALFQGLQHRAFSGELTAPSHKEAAV